jgi:hypothetical protein
MDEIMACAGSLYPYDRMASPRGMREAGNGKQEPVSMGGSAQIGHALRSRPEEARRNMDHQVPTTGAGLRTPRAAAAAGILFSQLLGLALILITVSAPSDPAAAGAW